MESVITLEPWSPWPLAFPAAAVAVAVAASIVGARRRSRLLREVGYVLILVAGLAGGAMAWTMSAMWDTQQRTQALTDHGYLNPTFGGVENPMAAVAAGMIGFQAVRDGERMRGSLVHLEGDQWEIREIGP